jgi:uncharacterized repeat protein (TIGR03803 family)
MPTPSPSFAFETGTGPYTSDYGPAIISALALSITLGVPFSYQIEATNEPTAFNATGLPAGLSVNLATGLISGTPTAPGTYPVSLEASNCPGAGVATLTLTIDSTVYPPVITSSLTGSVIVGSPFSYQITATNAPTDFDASPLPAGLSVDAGSGIISGTPTAPGASSIEISATNTAGTGLAVLILEVTAQLPAITSSLSGLAMDGTPFSYQIAATHSPTSFAANYLPNGLTVNTSTGAISGTPSAAPGTYGVELLATNGSGTGTATLSLVVAAALYDPSGVVQAADGNLYGTGQGGGLGYGGVFRLSLNGQYSVPAYGTASGIGGGSRSLLASTGGALLYGLTANSGSLNFEGAVFSFNTGTNALVAVYVFPEEGDAVNYGSLYPILLATDGNIYGTITGTSYPNGAIFKVTPAGVFSVLYAFNGSTEGSNPYGVIQGGDGYLYGHNAAGGSNEAGLIYRFSTSSGVLTLIYNLSVGISPIVMANDGNIYGAMYAYPDPCIFQLTTAGVLTIIHTLTSLDVNYYAALVQGIDGFLYGTSGGNNPIVFKISTSGAFTSFGVIPNSGGTFVSALTQASDGNFYGTSSGGGGTGDGQVFKMSAGSISTFYNF